MMNDSTLAVRSENIRVERAVQDTAGPASVRSIDKALSIFEVLLREPNGRSARDLATQTGINRTTAHRLLNSMIGKGWVDHDEASAVYRPSLRFVALARLALAQRDVVSEIRPTLVRLSEISRETTHLGVMDGFEVVHVDKVDSPERFGISSQVGCRAVPHVTGLGRALLAAGGDPDLDAYVRHARRLPEPHRLRDPDRLRADIAAIRERGYAIDDEEDSIGVRCIGIAVRGPTGAPVFAMSLTGPSPRLTLERIATIAPEVLANARALSVQLGWRSPDGD